MDNSTLYLFRQNLIRNIALYFIGIFSLLYSIFVSEFAKLHITLPFLNFPIFIGEILLALCVILFFLQFKHFSIHTKVWHYLLSAYICFILIKSFYGYFKWGPLAFRNAAMFYYAVFAIFGYYFSDSTLLKRKFTLFTVLSILCAIVLLDWPKVYFRYPLIIFIFVLFLKIEKRKPRYAAMAVFSIIYFSRYNILLANRTILVSQAIAVSLLFLALFYITKVKMRYKTLSFLCTLAIFLTLQFVSADKNKLKTLIMLGTGLKQCQKTIQMASALENNFKPETNIEVKLYEKTDGIDLASAIKEKLMTKTEKGERYGYYDSSDIALRLILCWDMLKEFIESKRFIFGLDFGRPFRPKTIWIMNWDADWKERVGWLEPHNSYIHILYRSGVVGLLFIIVIVNIFVNMAQLFIGQRNIKGILLCSSLLYWLIIVNFAVVLELPYFAIPFWSLFGVALRYSKAPQKAEI